MLYRVFPWLASAGDGEPGGALFNPRRQQGSGRHDQPELYGALYLSRSEISPVAERLAIFRGQALTGEDLHRTDGRSWALVGYDDARLGELVDLDEPGELVRRGLRPSAVATYRRRVTQRLSAALFEEGLAGFAWWSTLEATWSNVTLFAERALPLLAINAPPRALTLQDAVVRDAANAVGVRLDAARPGRRHANRD